MPNKEAQARIKINKLLEASGWRLLDEDGNRANVQLETNVKISSADIDRFGDDFDGVKNGFVDFLLLDDKGFPLAVLEAKRAAKNPLDGKEQARTYAKSQNVRFIILSNGDGHYFWDLQRGNPEVITEFPTQLSLQQRLKFTPNNKRLSDEVVGDDYIALCQNPRFKDDPLFQDHATREDYLKQQELRLLRPYQLAAIHALQQSAKAGNDRFLFEMATGTGKTLVSAAVIRLFLATGNANRVLFLVDRLELEQQAAKNFKQYLDNDFISVIYKQRRNNWTAASIVVSTVQSLAIDDKYKRFSPTDFDLIIADESHRAINGNARAVFEYFIGYKLGLTATPKDYLKNINDKLSSNDPRAWERRQLLDTYKTFGCESAEPTYRYSLQSGVKEGYLINPTVIDARTDVSTDLLSKKGYAVTIKDEEGREQQQEFFIKDFENKFFSQKTNIVFCQTFLEHAERDPINGEIGKSIIFCVSQAHASKITQLLNEQASQIWKDKYASDFAMQVSSNIADAGQHSINFANNNLGGQTHNSDNYKTSKTRVCVTVGMMTTGYDCEDILNIVLMRPIFSPTDFVQIKGRGTRKFSFEYTDENREKHQREKTNFKLFDFFAVCEYFEKEFNYDKILELPIHQSGGGSENESFNSDSLEIFDADKIKTLNEQVISPEGMKVDRELFARACKTLQQDDELKAAVDQEKWDEAVKITRNKYENKPELFLTLDKIRRTEKLDRRLSWQEFLQRVFGLIDRFQTKDEKLEQECDKFIAIYKPDDNVLLIKNFIKAYVGNENFRNIINDPQGDIRHQSVFPFENLKKIGKWRKTIPEYAKDYISFNTYID